MFLESNPGKHPMQGEEAANDSWAASTTKPPPLFPCPCSFPTPFKIISWFLFPSPTTQTDHKFWELEFYRLESQWKSVKGQQGEKGCEPRKQQITLAVPGQNLGEGCTAQVCLGSSITSHLSESLISILGTMGGHGHHSPQLPRKRQLQGCLP